MIDKNEKKNLLRDLISLSIKEYILKQPSFYLGIGYDGLPMEREYTIDDFGEDFGVKKSTIYRWEKSGIIPKKVSTRLIKEGILPENWEILQ